MNKAEAEQILTTAQERRTSACWRYWDAYHQNLTRKPKRPDQLTGVRGVQAFMAKIAGVASWKAINNAQLGHTDLSPEAIERLQTALDQRLLRNQRRVVMTCFARSEKIVQAREKLKGKKAKNTTDRADQKRVVLKRPVREVVICCPASFAVRNAKVLPPSKIRGGGTMITVVLTPR